MKQREPARPAVLTSDAAVDDSDFSLFVLPPDEFSPPMTKAHYRPGKPR